MHYFRLSSLSGALVLSIIVSFAVPPTLGVALPSSDDNSETDAASSLLPASSPYGSASRVRARDGKWSDLDNKWSDVFHLSGRKNYKRQYTNCMCGYAPGLPPSDTPDFWAGWTKCNGDCSRKLVVSDKMLKSVKDWYQDSAGNEKMLKHPWPPTPVCDAVKENSEE
ncbi:Uu.00g056700.m01.CDS01 [Anthostomella pinea]|uniref:Uu.00g056700.m01.CDS01 n=1 Tax=Anthostomella pinea TaxID=933095 RepID=A0AAI8YM81_9PEZI|nr:Uu.00g056700.m01.CDS01 [Anthostomella pinea]